MSTSCSASSSPPASASSFLILFAALILMVTNTTRSRGVGWRVSLMQRYHFCVVTMPLICALHFLTRPSPSRRLMDRHRDFISQVFVLIPSLVLQSSKVIMVHCFRMSMRTSKNRS
ncbi:uncharacterized protein BKA78DRAFT_318688 [Phyllosticta capitalensis]|uniref:uncharacterized protein n=1 Tax=Phyllosticta capitalensis TaxID=121624 RepID=UPI0031327FC9